MLLSNAASAQGQLRTHMEKQGTMLRVATLIDQDMREVRSRITRTQNGLLAPAFFSREPSEAQPFLLFVRGGWSNLDDRPRPDLQKIEYWLRDNKLERASYPMLDGAAASAPAVLLDNVETLGIAYRDARGVWVDQWQRADPDALPNAIRLTITRQGEAPLTLMFKIGVGAGA